MRSQTSERRDDVSPYLMVACVHVPLRKLPERFPTAWGYLIKLLCLCAGAKNRYTCLHWANNRYILIRSKKRTTRAIFLAHEKPLHISFFAWTAVINMRPPKSWWVTVLSFCMVHIHMWVLCFRHHTHYTVLLLLYSTVAILQLYTCTTCVIVTSLAYEQDWNRD